MRLVQEHAGPRGLSLVLDSMEPGLASLRFTLGPSSAIEPAHWARALDDLATYAGRCCREDASQRAVWDAFCAALPETPDEDRRVRARVLEAFARP